MSKYTDFYPSKVGSSFPYTGSAFITGSLAVTGSADFTYALAAPTVGAFMLQVQVQDFHLQVQLK